MKNQIENLFLLMFLGLISGCAVVEGIFKAGVGVGIFMCVAIVALVIYIMNRMRPK
jgi:hypothetical protein